MIFVELAMILFMLWGMLGLLITSLCKLISKIFNIPFEFNRMNVILGGPIIWIYYWLL